MSHDRLLAKLRERIGAGKLLQLIGRYLRAGVELPDGSREDTPVGVPQGGPLSPLLAKLTRSPPPAPSPLRGSLSAVCLAAVPRRSAVLDPLDKELERRGHSFARYADDFLIFVKSERAAVRVMSSVMDYVEKTLGLSVNRTKSRCCRLTECSFLGFRLGTRGKVKWSEKSLGRFKQRVKDITRRNRGQNVQTVIDELRLYARGWMNYFGISHTYAEVLELDEWMRRRVRLYHWKQWKRPGTRRRHLIRLGVAPGMVHRASRSRKGYWRMSQN